MRIYVFGAHKRPDETICARLRDLGDDVTSFANLSDLAQSLCVSPPDAILFEVFEISKLDVDMAVFQDLRHRSVDLPIVILSAQYDESAALEFIRNGAQNYLVRDFTSPEGVSCCLRLAIEQTHRELLKRNSETRMREVLELSYNAFIGTDSQLRITEWNAAAERTFGWHKEEIMGECLSKIVPHHLQRQFLRNIETYFHKEGRRFLRPTREIIGERRSGETFPAEFGIFDIDRDPNCVYCAFIRDISPLKRAQERLEKQIHDRTERLTRSNEELLQFAKIASHDLQEPLRAVEGFAYLLSDSTNGKLDSDSTEFIGFILEAVKRMKVLIQSILMHSQVDCNPAVEHNTDCNAVISQILTDLRPLIDESNAIFEIETLPRVSVEYSQVVQLFQNLIGNSLKYRSVSAPSISIRADRNADRWSFAITDNGIGIDPEYSDLIFDMFSRLHSTGRYSGAGIGLAICKKIVNSNGGKIWIESSLGHGSVFMFTLPAVKEERKKIMTKKVSILLAEDTPTDVRLAQEALKRSSLSYELTVVSDGVEALEYLAKAKTTQEMMPDIILLDLNMPKKNGHAVLAAIEKDPVLRAIPVVLLTVSEREEDVLEALRTKMNYYLAKPITTEKIYSLIKSIRDLYSDSDEGDDKHTKEESHIRLVLAGNPHTALVALLRLADDAQVSVRARVAENPRTPEELQLKLACDASADVRARLADNINVTASVLEILAKDENADVRLSAISSPSISIGVLRSLSEDENVYVCASAKRKLAEVV